MKERQDGTGNDAEAEPDARRFRPPSIARQFLRGIALGLLLYVLWLMIQIFL
ncbi:MAG: hypothetical protein ACE5F1_12225 [Planctomycetota bacterium]